MVRGQHHTTHTSQVFGALVTNHGDDIPRADPNHMIVTVMLIGDEPREYFDIGDQFALWSGHDVGHGVVTRRLFVWGIAS